MNEPIVIQMPASIANIKTMADNSIRVTLDFNELGEDNVDVLTELYKLKTQIGAAYVVLSNKDLNSVEIPESNSFS
jgi:hypothetical protein